MTQNEHLHCKLKMEALIVYSEVCGDEIIVILEMIGVKFQSEYDYPRPDKTESEAYVY